MNIKQSSNKIFLHNHDYSSTSTINFKTNITEEMSGVENRWVQWPQNIKSFDIKFSIRDEKLMTYILTFYNAMFGPARDFPFKDWVDCYVQKNEGVINIDNDQMLNGRPFIDLYKKYSIGEDETENTPNFKDIRILMQEEDEDERLYMPFVLFNNGVPATFQYDVDYANAKVLLPAISSATVNSINTVNSVITTFLPHNFLDGDLIYFNEFSNSSVLNDKVFQIKNVTENSFQLSVSLANINIGSGGKVFKYLQNTSDTEYNLSWEGEFLHRVRFTDDDLNITVDGYSNLSTPVKLKEVIS